MTLEDKLRMLVARWRAKADLWDADPEYQTMFRPISEVAHANVNLCADELEALLAERQPVCLLCGVPADECTNSLHREAEAHQPSQPALAERQEPPDLPERILCMNCGKSVSTPVPFGTIVRAWLECPECIEAKGKVGPAKTAAPSSGTGERK